MHNISPNLIEKAKTAKSAEELLEIAKENNVEMTAEEAATYFAQLGPKSGELDDDDLDNVAGGAGRCDAPTNQTLFPEGTKMRYKLGNCLRCSTNLWIAKNDTVWDIIPTCVNCGSAAGCYQTYGKDMADYFEAVE